jgi:hypothetical protein
LVTQHFGMVFIGEFTIPNFKCEYGLSINTSHYYSVQKGDKIQPSTWVLLLTVIKLWSVGTYLIFLSYFYGVDTKSAESDIVSTDYLRPFLVTDMLLPTCWMLQN